MTINTPQQSILVATPTPYADESTMGFLLRTAETNGYNGISKLLSLAGLKEKERRSSRPPLHKLHHLFGEDAGSSRLTSLDARISESGRFIAISNHRLPALYFRSKYAGLCPICVQENGYIRNYFELRYAQVCSKHHIRVISKCNACNKLLDWNRRGLTTCKCGADLSTQASEAINDPAVAVLADIIDSKLYDKPINMTQAIGEGFPIDSIQSLSLETLLGLILRFGSAAADAKHILPDPFGEIDLLALKVSAGIFKNWPHGFHDFLLVVVGPQANLMKKGLRGQFNSLYESLFKNNLPMEEVAFIKTAFVSFGQQTWQKARIDKRFAPSTTNLVGITGLSEQLGLHPSTTRKLHQEGYFSECVTGDSQTPLFIITSDLHDRTSGKTINNRESAFRLGIPISVLSQYRLLGYYQPTRLAIPTDGFNEFDIEDLATLMGHGAPMMNEFDEERHILLNQIMRFKIPTNCKADLLQLIVSGNLKPIGRCESAPKNLIFDRIEAETATSNVSVDGDRFISSAAANRQYYLNPPTAKLLCTLGKVEYYRCRNNHWILRESLADFMKGIVSCAWIAQTCKIKYSALENMCEEMGIPLLQLSPELPIEQSFIRTSFLAALGIAHSFQSLQDDD